MPDVNALYPQPPTNGLANMGIGQIIGAAQGLQNLEASKFELQAKQNNFLQDYFASYADKPNLSKHDLLDAAVTVGRNFPNLPSAMIQTYVNTLPDDPKQLRGRLDDLSRMVRGAEGLARPDTIGYGPGGAPISGTSGQATTLRRMGAPAAPGASTSPAPTAQATPGAPGIPGLPIGYGEAATGIAGQSARSANLLTDANDSSMARKGMLGNLEEDLQHFTAGPGADWTRFAKAWTNRNIPLPEGWQFDPKSIASQEQFNKQAAMLAQQQFSAIGGTGTDAKFNSAFTTSPNETLSQLGNKGIIRLLKGNEDAIQAKNRAWQQWLRAGNGPQTYAQFSDEFNRNFDPRAFQFKYQSKQERQDYIDRMDSKDRDRFLQSLAYGHRQGWISY